MLRRVSGAAAVFLLFVVILNSGCDDTANTAPDGGTPNICAPGLKPVGSACVPIFDECQDDEVPMLGGGCKHVGPPKTCLKGWEKVAGGWCEPILPKTKCPTGMMEKIGYSTCQPIGDCGTGTWGNIKTTATTIYVDQGHSGNGGKGTKTEPYKTIGEALNQATAGDYIAVASGTYAERVSISTKVTIEGRCAQMVAVEGEKNRSIYSTTVAIKSSGVVLRGVTISGPGKGLTIYPKASATVEHVAVQECGDSSGLWISSGSLTLRDCLVAGNMETGITMYDSKAIIERSVVRDTRRRANFHQDGRGIHILSFTKCSGPSWKPESGSTLVLRDSLVANNPSSGIHVMYSTATIGGWSTLLNKFAMDLTATPLLSTR